MTNQQRREFVQWLRGEFRRLNRNDGELSSPCIIYKPTNMVVTAPTHDPRVDVPMPPPRCLLIGSEAGFARTRELLGY